VTNPADSGTGTLRQVLSVAGTGDTITFDTDVFPPSSPVTIALTSALPDITQGHLTIDGSDAGVILDGSGIGAWAETQYFDDVSLTLDGGPNLLTNGGFDAGVVPSRSVCGTKTALPVSICGSCTRMTR